jgi:transposase InsO family protein
MPFYHKIHCKYRGIRGIMTVYNHYLKYRYMISQEALKRARILVFWEKYGLRATLDAFSVKRRTLYYNWKKIFQDSGGHIESLNNKSRVPQTKRARHWPMAVIEEIKRIRWIHPNLGKEKIYPILFSFCQKKNLPCPSEKTIGRIIQDLGGLRIYPQKITHFGKIKRRKRRKRKRKPKDFTPKYPGHLVALDTIEKHINGTRRYIISFEDIYTRFGFAWATKSHASKAATEFFELCQRVFPFPITFVLTDNGSEFQKDFEKKLKELHLTHFHTYPKTPKMNAHCERFNRTLQDECIDYHLNDLRDPEAFNRKLMDYLIWYNTERVHYAFKNKLSPVQFIISLEPHNFNLPQECNLGWPYT